MKQYLPANMPLNNVRWEHFARALANGEKQGKAYVDAGFAPNTGRPSRLAHDAAILKRVAFLLQEKAEIEQKSTIAAIKAVGLTKQMILDELWDNAQKAKAAVPVLDKKGKETGEYTVNWSASNRALQLLGKELGMFIDRKESGKPGDFDSLSAKDIEEAMLAIEDELARRRAAKQAAK